MKIQTKILTCPLWLVLSSTMLSLTVMASSAPEPYQVTMNLIQEPVSQEACILLLTTGNTEAETNTVSDQILSNEDRMTALQERYQVINEEIARLESGNENSIATAQANLDQVIEEVYQTYTRDQADFASLSAEEQLALVSQDSQVIEWQSYIDSLNSILQEYIVERSQIEQEYQTLSYDNDNLSETVDRQSQSQAQVNQCQLYPYSAKVLPLDQLMMNHQATSLSEYLLSVDRYLQILVPTAYRKVRFEDIYQIFDKALSMDQIKSLLQGKESIQLDQTAFDHYQYAKELSLFDIELLAGQAQLSYYQTGKETLYHEAYKNLINLKEAQFNYFYSLNATAFQELKVGLADYLNRNLFTDDASVEAVKSIHDRYQLKLVVFDDQNQTWTIVEGNQSFFSQTYMEKSFKLSEVAEGASDSSLSDIGALYPGDRREDQAGESTPNTSEFLLSQWDESRNQTPMTDESHDKLDYLKDKLAKNKTSSDHSSPGKLAKPTGKEAKKNNTEVPKASKASPKAGLPSTGEQNRYFWYSLILFLIGLSLIIYNRYKKYKKAKKWLDPLE